ncbi:MAG: DUF1799 domain-containing protein [Sneathiellaceae bacterium]
MAADLDRHLPPELAARLAEADDPAADSEPADRHGPGEDAGFRVWAEGWPVLQLFLGLSTQWRRAGLTAAATGLDYPAIAPTAALLGIEVDAERFGDLQAMEGAALRAWAEKRSN